MVFGLLGVLLAFAATFYFHTVVLEYKSLTVLDFLSLFLIVGIAADDMPLGTIGLGDSGFLPCSRARNASSRFILCHTYRLAPAVLGPRAGPRECMKWAYKHAGEAMLASALDTLHLLSSARCRDSRLQKSMSKSLSLQVTTVTTAGSFYANCISVLRIVKQFGFFMGSLVRESPMLKCSLGASFVHTSDFNVFVRPALLYVMQRITSSRYLGRLELYQRYDDSTFSRPCCRAACQQSWSNWWQVAASRAP